jgi:hypothetical protein
MPGAFDEREDAFEKRFVREEDLRFRALARRNKALGRWAAGLMGLSGEAAETYARNFVAGQVGRDDKAVAASVRQDLASAKVEFSDHRLRRKMEEELAEALAAVKSGG